MSTIGFAASRAITASRCVLLILRLLLRARFVDELQTPRRKEIGGIPVVTEFRRIFRNLPPVQEKTLRARAALLFRKIDLAINRIQRPHKTALPRRRAIPLSEVPLAGH